MSFICCSAIRFNAFCEACARQGPGRLHGQCQNTHSRYDHCPDCHPEDCEIEERKWIFSIAPISLEDFYNAYGPVVFKQVTTDLLQNERDEDLDNAFNLIRPFRYLTKHRMSLVSTCSLQLDVMCADPLRRIERPW